MQAVYIFSHNKFFKPWPGRFLGWTKSNCTNPKPNPTNPKH